MTAGELYAANAAAIIADYRIRSGKLDGLRGMKACRIRVGLSQGKLAEKIGVPKVSYQQWEHCRHWPSAVQLPAIASALGCSMEELFLGPQEPEGGAPE